MVKKLQIRSAEERVENDNYLQELSVLESMSGPNAGSIRLIDHASMYKKRLIGRDGTRSDELTTRVFVSGPESSGHYNLDRGTRLEYDEEEGALSFSSGGVRYKIRSVQDFDKKRIVDLSESDSPPSKGKSS